MNHFLRLWSATRFVGLSSGLSDGMYQGRRWKMVGRKETLGKELMYHIACVSPSRCDGGIIMVLEVELLVLVASFR